MAWVASDSFKYSAKVQMLQNDNSTTTRTVSGLNYQGGSAVASPSLGAIFTVISGIYSVTNNTITDYFWLTERQVTQSA